MFRVWWGEITERWSLAIRPPMFGASIASFRRAWEVLRREGPRSFFFKVLGETVYRRLLVIEREIGHPPVVDRCRIPVSYECLDSGALAEYGRFRPDADLENIRRRLEGGQECFVARHEGAIIHACWTATRYARIDYLDCEVALTPEAVYVYEVFTAPEFRGQAVSSGRSAHMERVLERQGAKRLVAAVWPENRAASRSRSKAGYSTTGKIGYWRLRHRKRFFHRSYENEPASISHLRQS